MQLNRTVIAYNKGSLRRAQGGEVVDEKQDNNTKLRLRGILDAGALWPKAGLGLAATAG